MSVTLVLCQSLTSCDKQWLNLEGGMAQVEIITGEEWLHDYPLLLGLKKKNAPQIAVWLEDDQGQYLATLYVSRKVATQGWLQAHGNRRPEALPCWCHARGIMYPDGLYCPTQDQPVADALTGATPRTDFRVGYEEKAALSRYRVMVEVNHSTDFNSVYTASAAADSPYYSGGKEGSGQPALVYRADIDLSADTPRTYLADLIGHSSPDGSDGHIYPDLEGLTTALHIVKQIKITIK